jgi:hypothetical protein
MKTNPSLRRRLPEHITEAIEIVLDHFWQDEARDYLARSRDEQEGHVFTAMLAIRQWLAGRGAGPRGGQQA